jgi:predicted alpha/beta superfamily hydrolase
MKKILNKFSVTFLLMISLMATGVAQEKAIIGNYQKLTSKILRGEVTYIEHLPEGYDKSVSTYPVVYLMNAQSITNFANACATVDNLASERIPDMILIGICNSGVAEKYWACPDDSGHMDNADRFNQFLEKELIPEINKKYRTNNYNILAGQSNPSLLVLNNMMHYPELFRAYVIISPMLGWCPSFQEEEIKQFLRNNRKLDKKLYINYGELDYAEVLNYIENYGKLLEQEAPAGLQWRLEKIINDGHVPYISLHNTLLFFFSACTLTPALQNSSIPEIRAHYEKVSKEYGFTVNPKGDVLMCVAWDMKEQKKFDRAIELFDYLVGLYPGNAMYLGTYGIALYKKGDLTGAREKALAALAIDPEQPHARALLEKLDKPAAGK